MGEEGRGEMELEEGEGIGRERREMERPGRGSKGVGAWRGE